MISRQHAFSRIDALVLITICAVAAILMFLYLTRIREDCHPRPCKHNLAQIGKAIYTYTQNHGGYYPFSAGPAHGSQGREHDTMTSLANLYPEYLATVKVFRCNKSKNKPNATPNIPQGATKDSYQWNQRNWTLHDTTYGYDCRIKPAAPSSHAIMADMDGACAASGCALPQNNKQGQNVLYVDGKVKWQQTNTVSNNTTDNIFTEAPWHADTDSYITRSGPDNYIPLTVSYEGYDDLHPKGN
jgi:hypothetical protein